MALFIGVDGGASRTVGVLVEDERVVARYIVGPTNPHLVGESGCLDALRDLFENLCRHASLGTVQAIWLGVAGVRSPADVAIVQGICATLGMAGKTRVSNDLVLALASAGAEKCGIAVVAGTGSCVFGVNTEGDTCFAGGLGHLLGDEGSGYAIAAEALRAASRFEQDRGPQTSLLPRLVARLGMSEFDEVARWTYTVDKSDISSLAPLVFESAEEGDDVAQAILENGARQLAGLAHDVAVKLGLAEAAPTTVLYGGLFEGSYFDLVRDAISVLLPTAEVVRPKAEGAVAAARLARDSVTDGIEPCEAAAGPVSLPVTEQRNWRSAEIDRLSTREMLDIINIEDRKVAQAVEQVLDNVARAVDIATEVIGSGGRVVHVGAGTSGRLGMLDAAECPPTFGVSAETVQAILAGGDSAAKVAVEGAEDDVERGATQIARREIGRDDLVVGISAGGVTPFVRGAVDEARKRGAHTVLVACNPAADFPETDVLINPVVGPEVITGSTRMKAGTATKMVLNMISTGAMVKLGKVYGNLMVDVQPRSAKLVKRARRILSDVTGVDDKEASELLERADNNLKVAIVMKQLSVDSETARRILDECRGNLRDALDRGAG
jgi:N-acetylmuramic acid 6-phosphate etherase